jgi:hypothetical protein
MSSCFLVAMKDDSIEGIYDTLKQCAMISKSAGGIGLHIHNIRATGFVVPLSEVTSCRRELSAPTLQAPMATQMASCQCFARLTPPLAMSTRVATSALARSLYTSNHGMLISLSSSTFAKITAKRRLGLVTSSMRYGYPTSCERTPICFRLLLKFGAA